MTRRHLFLFLFLMLLFISLIGCSQESSKEPLQLSEEEENYLDKAYFVVYQYDEIVNKFIDPDTRGSLSGEQLLGGTFAVGMFEETLKEEFVPERFKDTQKDILNAVSDTFENFTSLTVSIGSEKTEKINENIKKINPSIDTMKEMRVELEEIYKDAEKDERIKYIQHSAKDTVEMFN
jgi:hypothetical protein